MGIIWCDRSFSAVSSSRMDFASIRFKGEDHICVRLASIHFCAPDTTVYRFLVASARLRTTSQFFLQVKVHYGKPETGYSFLIELWLKKTNSFRLYLYLYLYYAGESVELQYKLRSYGIPTEDLPISFTGTIKMGYLKKWIRARETQESDSYLQQPMESRNIIECPQHTDVLFRQGISMMRKPGNARLRTFIEELQNDRAETKGQKLIRLKRREMVFDVIEEVRKTGRFLIWDEGGWWTEMVDQDQIKMKIEYLIKDTRRLKREGSYLSHFFKK